MMLPRKEPSVAAYHSGRLLSEGDLLPESSACPICGFAGVRATVAVIQKDPAIDFLGCPVCHGISASRMPKADVLTAYYAKYYDHSADELITLYKPQRLGRIIGEQVEARPADIVTILDFGGGDGTIALRTAEGLMARGAARGVDIVVVDHVQDNKHRPAAGISLRFCPDLNDVTGPFDIVIASGILEHVPDFWPALDSVTSLAKDGALFYARTPYMTPFARLMSIDLTYPAHVHDFGGPFWTRLAGNMDFDIEVLKNCPSLTETGLPTHFFRTIMATVLKAPARALATLGAPPLWPYYGGWQVLWRLNRRNPRTNSKGGS